MCYFPELCMPWDRWPGVSKLNIFFIQLLAQANDLFTIQAITM